MRLLKLLLVMLVCAAGPAVAGPLEDAEKALRTGDDKAAVTELRKEAERGNAIAQTLLGWIYLQGRGVPKDYAAALSWYLKGAGQLYAPAMYTLGKMYSEGIGVPSDYVQAYKWYNLAAASGDTSELAVSAVELAKDGRDEIARKMTPAQIAEAQKLASQWKPESERPWWKFW